MEPEVLLQPPSHVMFLGDVLGWWPLIAQTRFFDVKETPA